MATCAIDPSATVGQLSGDEDRVPQGEPLEPRWIGEFRIESELGRGAFGVVYQAKDTRLDRRVAIKRPLLLDVKLRDQYIKEARLAAQLDCQGIVPIYYVGTLEDGSPFVVQKLIDGPNLRSLLRHNSRLPAVHAARFVAEVARAVAVAHRQGMVHRDLKPDNILIDSAGRPWVADFGLALQDADQRGRRGEIAGTLPYMAPEQIQGRADWLDGRADIWALGVILYELLTGERPFQGSNSSELCEEIQHRDPRPIHQRRRDLPPELDAVVQRACHKKPVDRYQAADELADELEILLGSEILPQSTDSELLAQYGVQSIAPLSFSTRRRSRFSSASTLPQTSAQQRGLPVWWSSLPLVFAVVLLGLAFWIVAERRDDGAGVASQNANANLHDPLHDSPNSGGAGPDPTDRSGREAGGLERQARSGDVFGNDEAIPVATDTESRLADEAASSTLVVPVEQSGPSEPADAGVRGQERLVARPLIVSAKGDGSCTTIAEAVELAVPDERILISEGVYKEQLLLNKNVQLWARSPFADIEIVGTTGPALEIEAAEVTVYGIALRNTPEDGNGPFNTVEVRDGGRLTLEGCRLTADSYCCVRAMNAASLEAINCEFRAGSNSALVCIDTPRLKISKCIFRLSKKTAIEVFGGGAELTECEIWSGPGEPAGHQVGLYCERSEEGLVDVRDCTFRGCTAGAVNLVHGARASITDCRISDSRHGILVSNSELKASNTQIQDCADQAIRLEMNREAVIDNCQMLRSQIGLKLAGGEANVTSSTIANNKQLGIDASENSVLDLRYSQVSGNAAAGLLARQSTVVVTGGTFTGSGENQPRGIFARGGTLDVHDADITEHADIGIAFAGAKGSVQGGRLTGNALGIAVNAPVAQPGAEGDAAVEAESRIRITGLQIRKIGTIGIYFAPGTRGSVVDCFTDDPAGPPACVAGAQADVEVKGCNFGISETADTS